MEEKVYERVRQVLSKITLAVQKEPSDLETGIKILSNLRKEIYEDLNQIQHEAMILRAAQSISSTDFIGYSLDWYWNPRQTGSAEEPDLRGDINGKVIVSAEITTSVKPEGIIDKRMKSTLKNLNNMPGKKLYFVRTDSMEKRAKTKAEKAGYHIEVRKV